MAKKSIAALLAQLPVLIKSYGSVSANKTTGDTLREMFTDIIDSMVVDAIPIGSIVAWPGDITRVPEFWTLCTGLYGTPDIRDKFIMGGPGLGFGLGSYINGYTYGGSDKHSHEGEVLGHRLTIPQMPSHNHSTTLDQRNGSHSMVTNTAFFSNDEHTADVKFVTANTSYTGGNGSGVTELHNHGFLLEPKSIIPPYVQLPFIMYRGVNYVATMGNGIVVQVDNVYNDSVELSWNALVGEIPVEYYEVYRDGVLIDVVNHPSSSLTDLGLSNGTSFSYYILAKNDYRNKVSSPSNTVVATTTVPAIGTISFYGWYGGQFSWSSTGVSSSSTVFILQKLVNGNWVDHQQISNPSINLLDWAGDPDPNYTSYNGMYRLKDGDNPSIISNASNFSYVPRASITTPGPWLQPNTSNYWTTNYYGEIEMNFTSSGDILGGLYINVTEVPCRLSLSITDWGAGGESVSGTISLGQPLIGKLPGGSVGQSTSFTFSSPGTPYNSGGIYLYFPTTGTYFVSGIYANTSNGVEGQINLGLQWFSGTNWINDYGN